MPVPDHSCHSIFFDKNIVNHSPPSPFEALPHTACTIKTFVFQIDGARREDSQLYTNMIGRSLQKSLVEGIDLRAGQETWAALWTETARVAGPWPRRREIGLTNRKFCRPPGGPVCARECGRCRQRQTVLLPPAGHPFLLRFSPDPPLFPYG